MKKGKGGRRGRVFISLRPMRLRPKRRSSQHDRPHMGGRKWGGSMREASFTQTCSTAK